IPDLLRGVGGDPAAALRDDLDEPGDLEPAHGLHNRLLAHPELCLHLLDRNPGSDRVAAVEEPLLELVEDHLAQPVTRGGGRKGVRHRALLPLTRTATLHLACHIEGCIRPIDHKCVACNSGSITSMPVMSTNGADS